MYFYYSGCSRKILELFAIKKFFFNQETNDLETLKASIDCWCFQLLFDDEKSNFNSSLSS